MKNSENKICQNCKQKFEITSEDFNFYEKIKIPAPTFCPECRLIRKLVYRNDRTLYRKNCDNCKNNSICIYNINSPMKVYCKECWWSDNWNPFSYGNDFDFSKPFFEQYKVLFQEVPTISLFNGGNQINSDYCNYASNCRDCYLFIGGRDNERILYSNRTFFSKDSVDIYTGNKLELCYENINCDKCYRLFFGEKCENCSDSIFLYGCRNCLNCFGCTNLRNKNYCIFNKQYTREEYLKKIKDFNLGNFKSFQKIKLQFNVIYHKAIHKYAHLINTVDSTGDNLLNVRNCKYCFDISGIGSENCKYTHFVGVGVKDSYDNYGMPKAEKMYETIAIGFESNENSDYFFSYFIKGSNRIYYSYNCYNSHNLFACIGLRNKQYCILNKQYTKEQYEELVPKIIKHMNDLPYVDSKGRIYKYGEFFPPELSPFCYNETIAQEYFPLTKEEAINQGYKWKDREERNYEIDIKNEEIPDNIKDTNETIINKVIECAHKGECNEQCTEAFKIIESEYQFYQRMNLPLPRLCPNCRHYQRLKQRNPLKLWHRKCMHEGCTNEFETSYAPERPEIVYCEECYKGEIY